MLKHLNIHENVFFFLTLKSLEWQAWHHLCSQISCLISDIPSWEEEVKIPCGQVTWKYSGSCKILKWAAFMTAITTADVGALSYWNTVFCPIPRYFSDYFSCILHGDVVVTYDGLSMMLVSHENSFSIPEDRCYSLACTVLSAQSASDRRIILDRSSWEVIKRCLFWSTGNICGTHLANNYLMSKTSTKTDCTVLYDYILCYFT